MRGIPVQIIGDGTGGVLSVEPGVLSYYGRTLTEFDGVRVDWSRGTPSISTGYVSYGWHEIGAGYSRQMGYHIGDPYAGVNNRTREYNLFVSAVWGLVIEAGQQGQRAWQDFNSKVVAVPVHGLDGPLYLARGTEPIYTAAIVEQSGSKDNLRQTIIGTVIGPDRMTIVRMIQIDEDGGQYYLEAKTIFYRGSDRDPFVVIHPEYRGYSNISLFKGRLSPNQGPTTSFVADRIALPRLGISGITDGQIMLVNGVLAAAQLGDVKKVIDRLNAIYGFNALYVPDFQGLSPKEDYRQFPGLGIRPAGPSVPSSPSAPASPGHASSGAGAAGREGTRSVVPKGMQDALIEGIRQQRSGGRPSP